MLVGDTLVPMCLKCFSQVTREAISQGSTTEFITAGPQGCEFLSRVFQGSLCELALKTPTTFAFSRARG